MPSNICKYTPKTLKVVSDKYFKDTPIEEYTMSGFVLALDVTKQSVSRYSRRPELRALIRKARDKVENSYELSLRKSGKAGDIFALKQFGWSDQRQVDITSKGNELGFIALPELNKE